MRWEIAAVEAVTPGVQPGGTGVRFLRILFRVMIPVLTSLKTRFTLKLKGVTTQ